MNPVLRIVLAACAFLAAISVGAFGGCTVGVVAAYSQAQTAPPSNDAFYALIYAGAAVGLVMGAVLVRLILKPPRAPLSPRKDGESGP